MEVLLKFKLSEHLYLRDPEQTEIGKAIVSNAIVLIFEIGFEQFTFKKLAVKINSTEPTIYRYFTSKHKLLTYILNWYWSYLEYVCKMRLAEINDPTKKMMLILEIITHHADHHTHLHDYNLDHLHHIVISESSKSYLVKEVDEINNEMMFAPLKSLCLFISEVLLTLAPKFPYPKSLASTLLETAHDQQFFSEHLPKLTDNKSRNNHKDYVLKYLTRLTFSTITDP
ncbi:TetR family transcriptional regulator [Pedobacter yonginense]|uniref:TetR family transcriptional regulator n=1 Tax=Pedobacter yonginense TaxID=651869 RepID=A0A317EI89_9SPHI|nr:TetR/AcrR family transcriptional regulator [Pedobacter yonginense]PWS26352.1 TetR family transcriptional regulator [Pedobacter yonginense]